MITVVATFRAQEGMADAVIDALRKASVHARQEPGNIRYEMFRSVSDPSVVLMYEDYADQAALDAHGSSDYLKETFRTLKPLLVARAEVRIFPDTK